MGRGEVSGRRRGVNGRKRERGKRRTRRSAGQPRAIASTPTSVTSRQPLRFNPWSLGQDLATVLTTSSFVSLTSVKSNATRLSDLERKVMRDSGERSLHPPRVNRSILVHIASISRTGSMIVAGRVESGDRLRRRTKVE